MILTYEVLVKCPETGNADEAGLYSLHTLEVI